MRTIPERTAGLLTQRVGDELLVYSSSSENAHALNATAADVFEAIDDATPIEQLAPQLERPIVELAVAELADAGLIELDDRTMARRTLLRAAGATAVELPTIATITAPPAAAQASVCTCSNFMATHAGSGGQGVELFNLTGTLNCPAATTMVFQFGNQTVPATLVFLNGPPINLTSTPTGGYPVTTEIQLWDMWPNGMQVGTCGDVTFDVPTI